MLIPVSAYSTFGYGGQCGPDAGTRPPSACGCPDVCLNIQTIAYGSDSTIGDVTQTMNCDG